MGVGPPPKRRGATLRRSFGHAFDGLVAAAAQRNMKIHLVAGVLATSFAALAPLAAVERALIVLCTALVIAAEAANTALEALVDLQGGPPSEPGRIAKDAAAGAVLSLAVASVAVFAMIVASRWRLLLDGWRTLLPAAAAAAGAGLATGMLLGGAPPVHRAGVALGVVAAVGLAVSSSCRPCAFVPAALLVLAASARGGPPAPNG